MRTSTWTMLFFVALFTLLSPVAALTDGYQNAAATAVTATSPLPQICGDLKIFKRRWFSSNVTMLSAQHTVDLKACIYQCCSIPDCNALTFVGFLAKNHDSGGKKGSNNNISNNNNCLLFHCQARHNKQLEGGPNHWLSNNNSNDEVVAIVMSKMVARGGVLSVLILNRTNIAFSTEDGDKKSPEVVTISNSMTINTEESGEKKTSDQKAKNYDKTPIVTTTSKINTVSISATNSFYNHDNDDEYTLDGTLVKANPLEMDDDDGKAEEEELISSPPKNTTIIIPTTITIAALPTTEISASDSAEAIEFDNTLHKNVNKYLAAEDDEPNDYKIGTTIEATITVATKSEDGVGEIISSSYSSVANGLLTDLPYVGEEHSENPQLGTGIPGLAGYHISGGSSSSGQQSVSQNHNNVSLTFGTLSFNKSSTGRKSAPVSTTVVPIWFLGAAIVGGVVMGGLILAASVTYYCYWHRRRRMQSTAFKPGVAAPPLHAFNPSASRSQHPRRGSIAIISSAVSSFRQGEGVSGGRDSVSPHGSAIAAGAVIESSHHRHHNHHHHNNKR